MFYSPVLTRIPFHVEEGTVATAPPQTVLGIRKKNYYRQIAELLPAIAMYTMENCIPPAGPPVFILIEVWPEM
jgi:hypothetical protein